MNKHDLSFKTCNLSPAKRALLEQKLKQNGGIGAAALGIPRRAERGLAPLSFAQQRLGPSRGSDQRKLLIRWMAGVILGLSFIVHQIGSAGARCLRASPRHDRSYDGFMIIMGVIFLASAALVYSSISGKPIAAALAMSEART